MAKNQSPYRVHYQEGAYLFATDYGLVYACGFHRLTPFLSPVLGVYDIEVKDVEFRFHDPEPEKRKPQDPRISATITGILAAQIENERSVLIYLCDAADGRPEQRQRLFSQWHSQKAHIVDHEKIRIDYGDTRIYGGAFIPKGFPHRDVLQHELIDNAGRLILEKFAP